MLVVMDLIMLFFQCGTGTSRSMIYSCCVALERYTSSTAGQMSIRWPGQTFPPALFPLLAKHPPKPYFARCLIEAH